jgi:CrcB protein
VQAAPHAPRKLAAIYAGGVAGALIRVGLAEAFPPAAGSWPWPTFVANLLGALLLGYFFALFRDQPAESLRHPFLGTGVCGTLTTFSTLQLELYELVDGGDGGLALAYCAATLAAGYLCLRIGIAIERLQGGRPSTGGAAG